MRSLFVLLLLAGVAAGASRATFDIASYDAPSGWKSQAGPDAVIYAKGVGEKACLVSLLKSRGATSPDLTGDFAPAWASILQLMGANQVAAPTSPYAGRTGQVEFLTGSALTTLNGKPVVVMMFLFDGGARVMPLVAIAGNMDSLQKVCTVGLKTVIDGIVLKKLPRGAVKGTGGAPPAPAAPVPATVPPPPALAVADFAGDWHHDDHAVTSFTASGGDAYAASLSTVTGENFSADAKGNVGYHLVATANGQEIQESDTGTMEVDGPRLQFHFKRKGAVKYVITGWLDTDAVTILKVIPERYEPTEQNLRAYAQFWARPKNRRAR